MFTRRRAGAAEAETGGHAVEDVDAVEDAGEEVRARPRGEDGDVGQGVDALVGLEKW